MTMGDVDDLPDAVCMRPACIITRNRLEAMHDLREELYQRIAACTDEISRLRTQVEILGRAVSALSGGG